ncbi:MAG: OsmC family protein [Gemmatimonadota bacterium]
MTPPDDTATGEPGDTHVSGDETGSHRPADESTTANPEDEACMLRISGPVADGSREGARGSVRGRHLGSGVRRRLNGVPIDQLREMVSALAEDSSLAETRFRVRNRWVTGAFNRSIIQAFYAAGEEDGSRLEPFIVDSDDPPVFLGDNRGAHPMEYVLHGLAGCITSAFVYLAASHGVELDEVESTLEGRFDLRGFLGVGEVDAGFDEIRVRLRVRSRAPESELRELIELAQSRSPVFSTLARPVSISLDARVGR